METRFNKVNKQFSINILHLILDTNFSPSDFFNLHLKCKFVRMLDLLCATS